MKKILSCLLAVFMIASFIPSVFAEETHLQAIADSILPEMLTTDNEPAQLLTKDLDWSLDGDIELPSGVSVTLVSNDESVIKNGGELIRNSVYSLDASVTATVSDGVNSVSKELKYTVLRNSIKMHYADNFYYPELKDKEIIEFDSENAKYISNLQGWIYAPYTFDACYDNASSVLKENADGYAISYKRVNDGKDGTQYDLYKNMDVRTDEDVVTFSTTLNIENWGTTSTKRIDFQLYGHVNGGSTKKITELRFYSGSTAMYSYENEAFITAGTSGTSLSSKADKKLDIEINYASHTYRAFINGNQLGDTYKIPEYDFDVKLSALQIGMVRQVHAPGEFLIKDLAVYSDTASLLRYEELSNQSPNAITTNLTLPAFVSGKTVTWASSDDTVIDTNGTVARKADDTIVTLTASIEGVADKKFDFTVLGTRTSKDYWISSENFENMDAYQSIWGSGAGNGNGVVIDNSENTDTALSFKQILVEKSDEDVSRVMKLVRTDDQTSLKHGLATRWAGKYLNGLITLNAQLCFDFEDGETPVYAVSFYERGNGGARQNYIYFDYSRNLVNINGRGYDVLPKKGEWFDIQVKFDMPRETMRFYINGVDIVGRDTTIMDACTHNYYTAAKGQVPGFSGIYFNPQTANAQMYIDNLSVYAVDDDAVKASAEGYGLIEYDGVTPDEYAYSLAVVGDTQNLNDYNPDSMNILYKWIADNAAEKKMQYVIGLGDITNRNVAREFQTAKDAIEGNLKGVVPYSLVRGNHDSVNLYNQYFKYEDIATENTGSMDGTMLNTYYKFEVGSTKYMIIGLDFGPTDEMLEWANSVVEANPDRNVIVTTHGYIGRDGKPSNSLDIDDSFKGENVNRGEDIWNKFIKKHSNIKLVLAGHVDDNEIVVTTRKGDNGNIVTQMLIDPQSLDLSSEFINNGGIGLVAMLYFTEDGKDVKVEYYSTVQQKYFRENNQFEMTLETVDDVVIPDEPEKPEEKTISISGISFNVNLTGVTDGEIVLVALYNGAKLEAVKKYNAAKTIPVSFDPGVSGDKIELFRFNGSGPYPESLSAELVKYVK